VGKKFQGVGKKFFAGEDNSGEIRFKRNIFFCQQTIKFQNPGEAKANLPPPSDAHVGELLKSSTSSSETRSLVVRDIN